MSFDACSSAMMGLKVLGSPKVAITSRPPGMPGSQGGDQGCSGRGMAVAGWGAACCSFFSATSKDFPPG